MTDQWLPRQLLTLVRCPNWCKLCGEQFGHTQWPWHFPLSSQHHPCPSRLWSMGSVTSFARSVQIKAKDSFVQKVLYISRQWQRNMTPSTGVFYGWHPGGHTNWMLVRTALRLCVIRGQSALTPFPDPCQLPLGNLSRWESLIAETQIEGKQEEGGIFILLCF